MDRFQYFYIHRKYEGIIKMWFLTDVPGKDGCSRAYDVHKCLYKTDPDVIIFTKLTYLFHNF